MKKLSMILTVLIIFGTSAIGHTSDECVVFEGIFERSTRRPVAQFEHFQALDGEAIVKVYDEAGGHHAKKVTSATISINGKKVIGSRDFFKKKYFRFWHPGKKKSFHYSHFKPPDDVIEKTVALTKGQNSLKVMLNSRRGGKIKVAIVKPKFLASDDLDCDFISDAGDDNCPNDYNPDQADSDGDGIGDVCDDGDDGYPNMVIATTTVGSKYGPYGGIAVSPDGKLAYVSNQSDNTVYVMETVSNTVSDTITVGNGPFGVAVTPNGEHVYVSNSWDGTVSVIQTSNNTVSDITVGGYPYGVAVTPNGEYVYVCDLFGGKVYVIETVNNTVSDITVGGYPYGVAVTPNGEYVYVSDFGADKVYVIETVNNTVSDTITVGDWPIGVAVTPNGEYVYVSNSKDDTVSVIQTEGNTLIDTDPVKVGKGPSGVAVIPNSKYAYVNNTDDHTVSVIRTEDNTVIDMDTIEDGIQGIQVGELPYGGIAVSPDGKSVYVGNYEGGTVSVIGFED